MGSRLYVRAWTAAVACWVGFGCSAAETPNQNNGPFTGAGNGAFAGFGGPTAGTTGGVAGMQGFPNMPAAGSGVPPSGTAGSGGPVAQPPAGGAMPCAIQTIVQAKCGNCHAATPIFGAPMPLVTVADFQRDYAPATTTQLSGQTMKMYELARIRVNAEMGTGRMPQGQQLSADELAMLNGWLQAGAQPGTACGSNSGTAGMGGTAGTGAAGMGAAGGPPDDGRNIDDQCLQPGAFDPLVANTAENETCYDFRVHGRTGTTDTTPFSVPRGETYNQFYYAIPWEAGALSTRFGSDFDNLQVLHHWLTFAQRAGMPPGTVEPEVLGTTLFTDAELIAGWAVGGCTTTYPSDVGVKLPNPSDGVIMIQWHHYNNTSSVQQDASAVQICTVPAGSRPNVAGITFLGTEIIGVPAGMTASGSGTCVNDSGAPITIIGFTPHMHEIGIHMKSEVMRAAGGSEVVFDEPFQFDYQTNYMLRRPVVLQPNDRITSTCTWRNESGARVGFGQSTKAEMCYQFALSYPYPALNNGIPSLIGATNTCW